MCPRHWYDNTGVRRNVSRGEWKRVSVSMLDVLRPLSKHSFVSYLATSSKRGERTMYLPSTVFMVESRSEWHWVIHHFSIVKRLESLRHDEYLCAPNYYQLLHRRRIFLMFWVCNGILSNIRVHLYMHACYLYVRTLNNNKN